MLAENHSLTQEDTMQGLKKISRFIDHHGEHIIGLPLKIVKFDAECEMCQAEFRRISKRSDNAPRGLLKGDPVATVFHTTVLCSLGMHEECMKNYVIETQSIALQCICTCHKEKKNYRGRARMKNMT